MRHPRVSGGTRNARETRTPQTATHRVILFPRRQPEMPLTIRAASTTDRYMRLFYITNCFLKLIWETAFTDTGSVMANAIAGAITRQTTTCGFQKW